MKISITGSDGKPRTYYRLASHTEAYKITAYGGITGPNDYFSKNATDDEGTPMNISKELMTVENVIDKKTADFNWLPQTNVSDYGSYNKIVRLYYINPTDDNWTSTGMGGDAEGNFTDTARITIIINGMFNTAVNLDSRTISDNTSDWKVFNGIIFHITSMNNCGVYINTRHREEDSFLNDISEIQYFYPIPSANTYTLLGKYISFDKQPNTRFDPTLRVEAYGTFVQSGYIESGTQTVENYVPGVNDLDLTINLRVNDFDHVVTSIDFTFKTVPNIEENN